MTDKFESARAILHEQIVQRQAELDSLFAAYERLGGTYEDETAEAEEVQEVKRLTGPKEKKKRKQRKAKTSSTSTADRSAKVAFSINGQSIEMGARHRDVLEILQAAAGVPVAKRDLVACFAGPTPNWNQTQEKLNELLKPAAVRIVNVHGQGWKLEKLPA